MDAPNSCSPTTNSNTENRSLQESPISKYISNLSPIPAEKGTPVAQGFLEVTSSAVLYKSPKLCPRRKSSFTKRGLTPGLTATVIESVSPHVGLYPSLNSYNESSSHSHSSEVSQIRGSTQYPDELLDHVGNTASLDPKASSDMTTVDKSESVDQPPYSLIVSTDFVPKSDCGCTGRACDEIAVIPPAVTPETEEGHKISTSIDISAIEYGVQQGDDVSIHQLPKVQFNAPAAPVNQDQESMIKNKEPGQAHNFYQPYDFLPGYVQIDKENANSLEAAGAVWTGPEELAKAFQKPYLPRRSLLFEDSTHCDHPVNRPSVSGVNRSLSLEAPLAHIGSELQENFQPTYPSSLKPTTIPTKPSGIGLHLNSIVHTVKDRAGAVVNVVKSSQRANNICTQEKEPIPLTHSHLFHSTNSSPPFFPTESVYELGDSNMHRYASSSSSRCMLRPSNTSAMVNTVDNQLPPSTKRKYSCETDNGSEARSKERKNSSDTNDGNSCQRCNCKKSQCLKLYCDCFAAGIYCAEPCACQGCYNRPEYDDTVNERRLQIQSRNPLAFASKIDAGIQFTPSSARHKRGCNCKRSMCVKKYCECYQAKVGCSDGCRCQGCINTFGRKGEYLKDKDFVTEKCITETTDGGFIETMVESGNDLYRPDLVNPHNLTPVTPEVQFWKTDSSKGWLDSAQCLLGPSYVSPYVMNTGSPANLENSGTISQAPYKVQSLLRSDKTLYSDVACHISTISPQLGNTGNLIDKVSSAVEDEAPDILNHCLTQSVAVQVSSPNKKRVSPPHILQHKHGPTSVGGGAVGRRFILKSVPSFPPISRHLDFKNTSPEQGKHPQCNKDQT